MFFEGDEYFCNPLYVDYILIAPMQLSVLTLQVSTTIATIVVEQIPQKSPSLCLS